jgi:hypothetical protein
VANSETPFNKTFTVQRDKYGTGNGVVTISIRGSVNIFSQHDINPTWEVYSTPVTRGWQYVQIKVDLVV